MNQVLSDPNRTIALFINDFAQQFADALPKLSVRIGREVRGVMLIDRDFASAGRNTPDPQGQFGQIIVDFHNPAELRRVLGGLENELLFVTACADRNQPYLQKVLPHVPYVLGPSETSITWATHKHEMRTMLQAYDESLVPKFELIESASEENLTRIMSRLKFPVILKPTGLAASILVTKIHNEAELRHAAQRSFAKLTEVYKRDNGRGTPAMICEEFIVGDMYTIDAYVNETGRVWTMPFIRARTAHVMGKPGFYEFQADTYLELTPEEQAAGRAAAASAVHALGLRSCVAHIEMYNTADGWKIIELGPRAGGQRQDIYHASFGADHAYNEFLIKVGLEPEVDHQLQAYSTTIYLYPDEEGIIEAIEGVEEARANESIYNLHVNGAPGQLALGSENGGKWVIRGLLANPDKDALYRDAAHVRSLLKITTKPQGNRD